MKRKILYIACAAVLFFTGCGADPDVILKQDTSVQEVSAEEEEPTAAADTQEDTVCAYICGAVNVPGVYELQSGDRICSLVEMAGGLTQEADESSVNLAQTVADGEMIYIPTVTETAEETLASGDGTSEVTAEDGKVNINTATASELTGLSGIGDAKAAAIIAYREEHGSFQSIEEIMQVSGIAQATYDKIKDEITI